MISRRAFLLPGLSLCVPLAGCIVAGADSGWTTQRDEKRFTVEGTPDVVLTTFDGSIEVQSWDRPEVMVVIEKHALDTAAAASMEVQSSQDGNRVTVAVKPGRAHAWSWFGPSSARLIVSVPARRERPRLERGRRHPRVRRERHDRAAFGRRPHSGDQ